MIDVDRLYRDLTGQAPEPGRVNRITPQKFHGFDIPAGATATYQPEDRPYDLLVKYRENSIGINAKGPLMTDVGSNAPKNISEIVRKAIDPYAS
ncbi:MAG: hypothetical protein KAJ24_01495 [Candidatus Aenigmarchaeota archaeon]|nr:hypothetical protein [Candidatus Aenigmarchaeota archaeon]